MGTEITTRASRDGAGPSQRHRGALDGLDPIFHGAADFDLELLENRTLDGHTKELIYRPHPPLTWAGSGHGRRP
jgi:hypothetical protein